MEIHQLRYFLAIAQTGSFTAAARACHVSQPSLSSQVAKLEGELGGPLLERSRQGARLTKRGELFRPRAAEALRQLESGRHELAELAGLQRGAVTLGCMPTSGAYLLPPLLKAFGQAHPEIRVSLRESSSPDLAKALRESEADLAIMDEAGLGAGITSEALFSEPLLIALPPGHRLAGRQKLALKALQGESLIVMKSGHGFRKIVLDALVRAGVELRVVYESGEIETVQALVEAGLGVSLVPRMVQRGAGPVYMEIVAPGPSRTLHVAWREDSVLSPAAAALKSVALRSLTACARVLSQIFIGGDVRSALPLGPTVLPAGETRASSGQGAPVPQERMRLGGRGAGASPLRTRPGEARMAARGGGRRALHPPPVDPHGEPAAGRGV